MVKENKGVDLVKNKFLRLIILSSLCLNLTACNRRADLETSFDIIAELCQTRFAPSSQEEFMSIINKYADTCISMDEITEFYSLDEEVHTDITLTNYHCKYYLAKNEDSNSRYEATMTLSNGTVYSDIKVIFYVLDGKIINTSISII